MSALSNMGGRSLQVTIRREAYVAGAPCTFGSLYLGNDWECFTLEDPVRADPDPATPQNEAKVWGETAIPPGDYPLVLTMSPRLKIVTPELRGVPGFTGIRIHVANRAEEVAGCIAVGSGKARDALVNSRVAFNALMVKLGLRQERGFRLWCRVE